MATPSKAKVSLKLLIDPKAKRVLFAEAGKDFVDFLVNLLRLPIGTVVRLLKKRSMVGALGNLYGSIEKLSETCLEPNQTKQSLLNSKATTGHVNPLDLLDEIRNTVDKRFYVCNICDEDEGYHLYVSNDSEASCPVCKAKMSREVGYVSREGVREVELEFGGFVKPVTYMVTDDLVVTQLSTISGITMLNKFNVKEVGALEERVVDVGMPEAFNGLRTAVRAVKTRGYKISFDELVTMMKSEEVQLSKETSDLDSQNIVLVASHGTQNQNHRDMVSVQTSQQVSSGYGSVDSGNSQQNSGNTTQHYFPTNNPRNNNRGRGGRSKFHCDICGRNNHSTNYCYYRSNGPGFQQWQGYSNVSHPQFSGPQPQFSGPQSQYSGLQPQFSGLQPQFSGPLPQFSGSQFSGSFHPQMYGSQRFPVYQNIPPTYPNVHPQSPRFSVGFNSHGSVPQGLPMVHSSVINPSGSGSATHSGVQQNASPTTAFAGFTDSYNVPYMPHHYAPGVAMSLNASAPVPEYSSTTAFEAVEGNSALKDSSNKCVPRKHRGLIKDLRIFLLLVIDNARYYVEGSCGGLD
ncbi:hypothetical protein Vadar_002035 [Vaccinium darrowii]|uniref:Uncharacterized protein n=1 Tax=Vaccinium darrowii TaxID=229202 RepID=A0ACB7XEW7_9ERIC|nr:hypothetical protein Vadar_002035 [Vaccinium darrowii]